MPRLALPAALAALLLLSMALPAQAAFHTSAWTATGVATDSADRAYLVSVHWHGLCYARFTVTVSDPVSGAILDQRTFSGYETSNGFAEPYLPEILLSQGYSTDPSVKFTSTAAQVGSVNFLHMTGQAVTGTYQGLTWEGVVAELSWSFCEP